MTLLIHISRDMDMIKGVVQRMNDNMKLGTLTKKVQVILLICLS